MTSKAPAAATAPTPTAWAFHYSGPLANKPDYSCVTCLAVKQCKCPAHGQSFALHCAHCTAAQGGECHGHWGLDAAIEHYKKKICPQGAGLDFDQAIEIARLDIEALSSALAANGHITIDAAGSGAGSLQLTGRRSFTIEIFVR